MSIMERDRMMGLRNVGVAGRGMRNIPMGPGSFTMPKNLSIISGNMMNPTGGIISNIRNVSQNNLQINPQNSRMSI
jgi:hypothetical protein